ncbi:MAG: hypothetical protein ACT6Q8_01980 [Niveispirillum sp.]|uniref:hypothetical protein n=1 Tax=Niveispirillum sp. TaxID=1917217 RepID=UPI0006B9EB3D
MVAVVRRQIVEWDVKGKAFALLIPDDGAVAELRAPGGPAITLTRNEWTALAEIIQTLDGAGKPQAKQRRVDLPANAGASWNKVLDAELSGLWQDGMDIAALARRFERTEGGIRSRLKRLGFILPEPEIEPEAEIDPDHA